MPFLRDKMPNPIEIRELTINDFSGGLCNASSPLLLKNNQAWRILNMKFTANNLMEKRPGTHPIDDLILNTPICYMDVYKPINKEEVLIRATENSVYAGTTKICDVAGKIQGVTYIGNYYFVDGAKLRLYDGTSVYEIVEAPHAYLKNDVEIGATEMEFKDWDDRIEVGSTIYIEGLYTHICTVSTINKETSEVTFTPAVTNKYDEDTFVRLYNPRNESYVEGEMKEDVSLKLKWYEPCAQELNDVFKGECFIQRDCTSITYDTERLYISSSTENPHEIYISDINNPFYFPVQLGMQCPPNGDKVIDVVRFDESIVVGRQDDIHVIKGETNIDTLSSMFTLTKFDTHAGFASVNNARLANDYLFYLGSDMNVYGMHSTQYNSQLRATIKLNKDTIDLKLAPLSFTYEDIKYAPAVFYENEYYIVIKDKILVYNFDNRAFTVWSGMNATYFIKKGDQLLIGTANGKVCYIGGEYNDDGKPIECYYQARNDYQNEELKFKDYLDMFAVTHVFEEADSGVTLTALVDHMEVDEEFDIRNQISRFGITKFGDILISRNIAQTDDIPLDTRGRSVAIVFSNKKYNEPLKVYQINLTYKLRGVR